MNIMQAVKTGKPFRHKDMSLWVGEDIGYQRIDMPVDWILSEEWEVKEQPISLTRSEFFTGVRDTLMELGSERKIKYQPHTDFENLVQDAVVKYWNNLVKKSNAG